MYKKKKQDNIFSSLSEQYKLQPTGLFIAMDSWLGSFVKANNLQKATKRNNEQTGLHI